MARKMACKYMCFNRHTLFLLFVFVLCTPGNVIADSLNESLKDRVSHKLQSSSLVSGEFVQEKTLSGFPRSISSTGRFLYWRTHGLYWETLKPFSHATTFMAKEVLHWKNGQRRETHQKSADASQKHISRILLAIFNGDLAGLEDYFHIQWEGNDSNWLIRLVPSHSMVSKTLSNIKLTGNDYLETLSIANTNGDKTFISFTNSHPIEAPLKAYCKFFALSSNKACN